MGHRPNSRSSHPGVLHLRCHTAIAALLLGSALVAAAQTHSSEHSTVEVRLQLIWPSEPLAPHSPSAVVTLDPSNHRTPPQQVRVSSTSVSSLTLAPGRYQLITTAPLVSGRQAYGWNVELALFDAVNDVRLSSENAVRLEAGDVIEPASKPPVLNASATSTALPSSPVARQEIVALLEHWASSLQARDLNGHMSCYAPQLARYLQQHNVSSQQVRAEKRKLLDRYPQTLRLQLHDINVSVNGGQVVGTALEYWRFSNSDVASHGHALVNFEFAQVGSRWVITSQWEQPAPQN